ncbi:Bug family tripartite tricarboxylate transporter substrate binding protein [Aureimonas phyllosphaerae]|uniref:Putative tricarboxylic transport membrane protein n=1 Tax=Aureimonas phyllosphaerae TaxID=1166078 RepID=A0A7W6BRT9_9HYPH|nr:tripartite tricarboxylate transporter substrate-binding protein [Aureimonas phyllosphaerae]MBB3936893.1 putative tricarboxylic transport membrane protein [Aureimonas phyllosphaerae]MBB3960992.1 putative tricarboxylic transport membrane protein [Aureimonas phyllosphaerae]SFF27141.1 putative tricarboxylic transport membrane protein [Aureimonas phyllosphaerae]
MKSIIFGALAALLVSTSAFAQAPAYEIMAPASPGGGWDQTARAMQNVLQETKLASNVQVVNVPGAGGTIGLAQFVSTKSGNPNALLVGGYVMVGAILTNKSPVTLDQVTPLARLTGEDEAIVVPASSPYQTIADLAKAMKENPGAVAIAGGSAGGTDHIAAGLLAQAVGADPKAINYIAFSGGGEALAAILGQQVAAGISGYGEFESQVKAGTLRLLATTGGQRVPGSEAPTLKEAGIDMELQNWRMVAGAPGLTADEQAATIANMQKMVDSPEWKAVLERNNWQNTFLAGDAFKTELAKNIEDTKEVLTAIGLVQ